MRIGEAVAMNKEREHLHLKIMRIGEVVPMSQEKKEDLVIRILVEHNQTMVIINLTIWLKKLGGKRRMLMNIVFILFNHFPRFSFVFFE
jgi:hypothetical protein